MVRVGRFVFRSWFYFRIGYSTYLAFILGMANAVVVVWYLAIAQLPDIQKLFGHFLSFAVFSTLLGIPISIAFGWLHTKRTQGYSSEVEIQYEATPYYYRLKPGGYEMNAEVPTYLELLRLLRSLLSAQGLLRPEDLSRMEELEQKLHTLIEGGYLRNPKN
jgi:hypothetical protein